MTNINRNSMSPEQIKNESTKALDLYKKFKIYLEKDEFGISNLKAAKILEAKIVESESKIKSLQMLKVKSEQVLKKLNDRRKFRIEQNKKLKESLIKQLNSGDKK